MTRTAAARPDRGHVTPEAHTVHRVWTDDPTGGRWRTMTAGAVREAPQEPEPKFVTPEEGRLLIDSRARSFLGMSGEEFRRRYEAGELDPEDDNVLRVAMLLPLGR